MMEFLGFVAVPFGISAVLLFRNTRRLGGLIPASVGENFFIKREIRHSTTGLFVCCPLIHVSDRSVCAVYG